MRAYHEARAMARAADAVLKESNWKSSALKVINELMAAPLFQAFYGFEARKTVAPSEEEPFSPDLAKKAEKMAVKMGNMNKGQWEEDEENPTGGESGEPIWETGEMHLLGEQEPQGWGQQQGHQGTAPRGGFGGGVRGGPRGSYGGRGRGGRWNHSNYWY